MEPAIGNTTTRSRSILLAVVGMVIVAVGVVLLLIGLHGNYYCSFYPEVPGLFYPMGGAVLLILGIVCFSAATGKTEEGREVTSPG